MNKPIYMYIVDGKLDIEKVMDDYTGYIWKVIQNCCNLNNEDIEEIISDTYFALWNNQNKLDLEKSISSYLAGIARNLVKKKYRDIRVEENIDNFEEKLASDLNFENDVNSQKINNIINTFKSEDKEIFVLFYYNNMKIKDISSSLNISDAKVKTKLHRIRKSIKKELLKGGYGING